MRFSQVIISALLLCFSFLASGQTFHQIGLSGGGATFVPTINPLDKNIMFASCDMSGFYRSADAGVSWTLVDWKQLTNPNIECYPVFHPSNKDIMYYASGRALKTSVDGGVNWSTVRTYSSNDSYVYRIYVDPLNASNVYVGTAINVYQNATECTDINDDAQAVGFYITNTGGKRLYAATKENIWRSDDDGANWVTKNPSGPTDYISFCGGSDGVTTRLWAVGGNGTLSTVFTSTTNGDTWAAASTTGISAACRGYMYNISCAENDPNIAYVSENNVNDILHITVYKTTDGGATWSDCFISNSFAWQASPPPDPAGCNVTLGWQSYDEQGWNSPFNYGMTVCKSDSSYVIGAGGGEVYLTKNSGTTWEAAYVTYADSGARGQNKKWKTNGLNVTTTWNYYIHPSDPLRHYICYTDIGFARSEDGGLTWISSWDGSPFANTFYNLAFDPNDPATIYAAATSDHDIPTGWGASQDTPDYPGGPIVSHNYGVTWAAMDWTGLNTKDWGVNKGGVKPYPCTGMAINPTGTTMYITQYGDGVYKSVKSGSSWGAWTNLNCPAIGSNNHFYKVLIHSDGSVFAGLVGRIWYDGGSWGVGTWQTPDPGTIYRSTNAGATWTSIATNIVAGGRLYDPRLFEVDPVNSNIVYFCGAASRNPNLGGASDHGVYKTTNGGVNWTKLVFPVSFNTPETITIDQTYPNTLYLSTGDYSLLTSYDAGANWTEMSFPFKPIDNVYIDPMNRYLYVCTYGCGIWTNAPTGGTVVTTAAGDYKPVIFPNPCNISEGGRVKVSAIPVAPTSVEFFNGNGELVRSIATSFPAADGYYVVWDGKNSAGEKVARGTYLFSITTSLGKKTGKVSILK